MKFWNDLTSGSQFPTANDWFESLADTLMNDMILHVGGSRFRITECEFYYYDEDHPDVYVHQSDAQMSAGQLHLNKAGGFDITFGNKNYPAWGGILIRGMRNLESNEYHSRVTDIVTIILRALDNIVLNKGCVWFSAANPANFEPESPVSSTRVGLRKKEEDLDDYISKPYRFLVELNPNHKFKEKEKVVKELFDSNAIDKVKMVEILGYQLKGI